MVQPVTIAFPLIFSFDQNVQSPFIIMHLCSVTITTLKIITSMLTIFFLEMSRSCVLYLDAGFSEALVTSQQPGHYRIQVASLNQNKLLLKY